MKKEISTSKLREILKTINTRIVKEIEVKECSNHRLFKLYWYDVTVGSNIYIVNVLDMDPYYTQDAILYFNEMLSEFKNLNILYYKGI